MGTLNRKVLNETTWEEGQWTNGTWRAKRQLESTEHLKGNLGGQEVKGLQNGYGSVTMYDEGKWRSENFVDFAALPKVCTHPRVHFIHSDLSDGVIWRLN